MLYLCRKKIEAMCKRTRDALCILAFSLFLPVTLYGQEVAVKTNLLYDATTTFNLGVEVKLSRRLTFDLPVNYNPWTFGENKKLKHVMVQPELRYWLCESFFGHFFGLHAMYAHYNVGGLKLPWGLVPELETTRYQGNLYGAGISYGYQKILSPHWSLGAEIGAGYVYLNHKAYDCATCGAEKGKQSKGYLAPTKVALNLIYIIR